MHEALADRGAQAESALRDDVNRLRGSTTRRALDQHNL